MLVTFDLWFTGSVERQEAEQQMKAGLEESGGLVVDRDSVRITGEFAADVSLKSTGLMAPFHRKGAAGGGRRHHRLHANRRYARHK